MLQQIKPGPKYLWPRFVAAAILVGVFLAVLAVQREARRIKRIKASTAEQQMTNPALETPGQAKP